MRNNATKQFQKVVYIYYTGETEKNYIQALCQDRYRDRKIRIEIKPKLRCSFEDICQAIADDLRDYETELILGIYLLIDLDEFYSKNLIGMYEQKKADLSRLDKAGSKLLFVEARPCIEFWFLLHFVSMPRVFDSCKKVVTELKKPGRLPQYEKTQRYTQQVYGILNDKLGDAICRSQEICNKEWQGQQHSYSLMHLLIQELDRLSE